MKAPPKYLQPNIPNMPQPATQKPQNMRQALGAWMAIPKHNRKGLWAFLREEAPWALAHHPEHPSFLSHVWTWRGVKLCKGCVMTWLGAAIGMIASLVYSTPLWLWSREIEREPYGVAKLALVYVILLLPTVTTSLIPAPTITKRISRLSLGFLIGSALIYIFSTERGWPALLVILCWVIIQLAFGIKRRKENQKQWDAAIIEETSSSSQAKYKQRKKRNRR